MTYPRQLGVPNDGFDLHLDHQGVSSIGPQRRAADKPKIRCQHNYSKSSFEMNENLKITVSSAASAVNSFSSNAIISKSSMAINGRQRVLEGYPSDAQGHKFCTPATNLKTRLELPGYTLSARLSVPAHIAGLLPNGCVAWPATPLDMPSLVASVDSLWMMYPRRGGSKSR